MYLQKKIYMHVRNSWYYNLLIINGIINVSYFFYSVHVLRPAMLTSEMRCVINRNHFSTCWSKFWRIYFWFYNLRLFNRQIGHIDTCNVWACVICYLHLLIWATPASQATIIKPVLQVCVGHFFSSDKVHHNSYCDTIL